MPINNLNNFHLTEAKKNAIQAAISTLEAELNELNVTLTAQERQLYGSVNEQNKLFINKTWDFHQTSPELSDKDMDWDEFEKDMSSRNFYEGALNKLDALSLLLRNSKILHDYDNFQAALDDYSYTIYKAGGNKPGFETKRTELKQFFLPRKKNDPPTDNED